MKKLLILVLFMFAFILSGCGEEEVPTQVVEEEVKEDVVPETIAKETIDTIKFNSNLEVFEEEWLTYLEERNPNSKIYHVKTKNINCEDCYEVYYKKDLSMIKIKVLDGEKSQETAIVDGLFTEIDNAEVCSLYSGKWNECPSLCNTDEEACATQCGIPTCELDQTIVEYVKLGGECGTDKGDCEFGFSCYFNNKEDRYGTCK